MFVIGGNTAFRPCYPSPCFWAGNGSWCVFFVSRTHCKLCIPYILFISYAFTVCEYAHGWFSLFPTTTLCSVPVRMSFLSSNWNQSGWQLVCSASHFQFQDFKKKTHSNTILLYLTYATFMQFILEQKRGRFGAPQPVNGDVRGRYEQ